jgi:hypothetical protein
MRNNLLLRRILFFYSKIENLFLRARSELTGPAIAKFVNWFQVSGITESRTSHTYWSKAKSGPGERKLLL